MEEAFRPYLTYLKDLCRGLEKLSALAEEKIAAVNQDDLMALNDVLNREQAMSLSFRGLEQTRARLQKELGLEGVPLSQLPNRCPPALSGEVREAAVALRTQHLRYQKVAAAARNLLEKNLREIEGTITSLGGTLEEADLGPGYLGPEGPQPPKSMKTDFRA